MFCALLYVTLCPFWYCSRLGGGGELVALLGLSSWCLMVVGRLFLAVPRGCLQFVIVVFPDHTHLLFFGWCLGSSLAWPTMAQLVISCTLDKDI